jgi:hypothetical protein
LFLAFAQVFGAALAFGLLLAVGVTTASLSVVVSTGLCTTVSILLFGSPRKRGT